MNEKLDYKFGKYDLDFLIKLKAHEFRKQKIDNISEKEIRNYLFNIKWKSQKSLPMCDIIDDVMNLQFSEIFDYLSIQAVKEASTLDLKLNPHLKTMKNHDISNYLRQLFQIVAKNNFYKQKSSLKVNLYYILAYSVCSLNYL